MHRLQTEPHAVGRWATISVNSLRSRDVAQDEQLGERVVVAPVLCTHWIVLWVRASVAAAPANCQLKPEPELTTTLAEPSRRWLSHPF